MKANDNYNPINNYNPIFNLFFFKKLRQTRTRKADESVVRIEENSFIF